MREIIPQIHTRQGYANADVLLSILIETSFDIHPVVENTDNFYTI